MVQKVEISHRTIIFAVLFLVFLWFIYQIRQLLVSLFVGILLMSALNPLVEKLERFKIPRFFAVILIYFLVFALVGVALAGVIPPLVDQTGILISRLPGYLESFNFWGVDREFIDRQTEQFLARLGGFSLDLVRITLGIFGNIVSLFVLIFISFYLVLERKNLDRYLFRLFGSAKQEKAAKIIHQIEKRLGKWVGAQLTLMVVVGIMCYIGLRLLGIEYALPLALLAGILEIVPNIGPVLSAIPAVLVGLTISPLMGLSVVALYFLVQQLENQIIVPQVMKKEVGVNPLVTILALIAGFKVGGAVGGILALPLVILGETLLGELFASGKFKKA